MPQRTNHRYFLWLALDGLMVTVFCYTAVRESLFLLHDTTGPLRWVLYNLVFAAGFIASNLALVRLNPPEEAIRWPWRKAALFDMSTLLCVFQFLPALLVSQVDNGRGKGVALIHVVADWHMLVITGEAFLWAAPLGTALLIGLFSVLVYLGIVWGRRWAAAIFMTCLWGWFASRTSAVMVDDPALFFILFLPATGCSALAMVLRRPRFAARTLAWSCAFTFLGLVYLGDLPLGTNEEWRKVRGVTQLYPCDDSPLGYPIRFPRDIWVDTDAERIYLAYGPSSGIVSMDLHTGCMTGHFEANGMVRHMWSAPERPYVYAIDDVTADVYALEKRPMRLAKEIDLYEHCGMNDGFTIATNPTRDLLYVNHYSQAAISEINLDTLEYIRTLFLAKEGYTSVPASMVAVTVGENPSVGYATMGPVDPDHNFRAMRLDLDTLTVTDDAIVPGATLYVWYSRARHSFWYGGGNRPSIIEVDANTLEVRREVPAPRLSMAFAAVEPHGVIVVAGAASPELHIICEETGEAVHVLDLGPKTLGIHYAEKMDAVFVASSQGVFRIDRNLLRCPE